MKNKFMRITKGISALLRWCQERNKAHLYLNTRITGEKHDTNLNGFDDELINLNLKLNDK